MTQVKLKNGSTMIVCSDNTEEKTMDGYSVDLYGVFDVTVHTLVTWNYSDIVAYKD